MKRKRPFLLLEVLIALALVAMFSVPLIRGPLVLFRSQMESFIQLECERIASLSLAEIKEKLYLEEVSWENPRISLPPVEVNLPHSIHKKIDRECTITVKDKEGEDALYRIMKIKLTLHHSDKKETYWYQVFLQKIQGEA